MITKSITCFLIVLFAMPGSAQSLAFKNAVKLHSWQWWTLSGPKSANIGIAYTRDLSNKFDVSIEVGRLNRYEKNDSPKYKNSTYVSMGGSYFLFKKRIFYINPNLMLDVKKGSPLRTDVILRFSFGFVHEFSKSMNLNLYLGLLNDQKKMFHYLGGSFGKRF